MQLSDVAVDAFATNCSALEEVSLNRIAGLTDASLVALTKHGCHEALRTLDLSWCRGVSDAGVGALVDACEALEHLAVWGCSQLTQHFFNGHSNDQLVVVGRGLN